MQTWDQNGEAGWAEDFDGYGIYGMCECMSISWEADIDEKDRPRINHCLFALSQPS